MEKKRGWIIAGVALLQVMLLVAAFSVGVYIARHGLTRGGLSYQGPGAMGQPQRAMPGLPQQGGLTGGPNVQPGDPNQAPLAPGQLPFGLTEPPQVLGRLLNISPMSLEVATPEGPRIVAIGDQTNYADQEGQVLTLADLRQGMIVAVYGILDDGGHSLLAMRVIVLEQAPAQRGQPSIQPVP